VQTDTQRKHNGARNSPLNESTIGAFMIWLDLGSFQILRQDRKCRAMTATSTITAMLSYFRSPARKADFARLGSEMIGTSGKGATVPNNSSKAMGSTYVTAEIRGMAALVTNGEIAAQPGGSFPMS
jgi:hypothetical protein